MDGPEGGERPKGEATAPKPRRDPRRDAVEFADRIRRQAKERLDEVVPPHIQKEAHRKGFHMTSGIIATPLFLYTGLVYGTMVVLITLAVIVVLEVLLARFDMEVPFLTQQLTATRRHGETFSWASTMFLVAGLAIIWLTPLPVAFAGLAMLGLGDGFSALVGKAVGKHKLWYNRQKSWEGTIAGFVAGSIGAVGLMFWYYAATTTDFTVHDFPVLPVVPIALIGALAGSIAESMPQWEDNVSVPIATAGTMVVLWMAIGLTPRFGPLVEWVLTGRFPGI
ncbi:MAG: SEC59/DGK1/VTE5 family protein [Euryarchaeota archaeon]|nr:SEC59/DGK1/VTE5 family protein [Euryarchaeota archaeon]